jgi:hypothetical protein
MNDWVCRLELQSARILPSHIETGLRTWNSHFFTVLASATKNCSFAGCVELVLSVTSRDCEQTEIEYRFHFLAINPGLASTRYHPLSDGSMAPAVFRMNCDMRVELF